MRGVMLWFGRSGPGSAAVMCLAGGSRDDASFGSERRWGRVWGMQVRHHRYGRAEAESGAGEGGLADLRGRRWTGQPLRFGFRSGPQGWHSAGGSPATGRARGLRPGAWTGRKTDSNPCRRSSASPPSSCCCCPSSTAPSVGASLCICVDVARIPSLFSHVVFRLSGWNRNFFKNNEILYYVRE